MERISEMNHGKVEHIGSYRRQCRGMYEFLQEYARAGIQICLDGKEADPGRVASTCLREGVSYMMDFIPETYDSQKISRINFTRIDPCDPEPARVPPRAARSMSSGPYPLPGPASDSSHHDTWCS